MKYTKISYYFLAACKVADNPMTKCQQSCMKCQRITTIKLKIRLQYCGIALTKV